MKKEKFSGLDGFFYYTACIITVGAYFIFKVAVKKAIQEMVKD